MPPHRIHGFDEWRSAARTCLQAGTPPGEIGFVDAATTQQELLFGDDGEDTASAAVMAASNAKAVRVPRDFLDLAQRVACHRDPLRYDLLYRALWRLTHGAPHLLDIATDDDTHRLTQMDKSVRRAAHKTKAFVRFCKLDDQGQERYVAWHQPEHRILPLVAPFFSRRFPAMHWTILTPDASVTWDFQRLIYGPGVPASQAPERDVLEELWKTYYGSIFNPARIKINTMKREMPVRHWATLPETQIIPELLADAPRRVAEMIAHSASGPRSAADFLPPDRSLPALTAAASHCQGCELHGRATQTVFGRGPATARLMLVGEQPGDQEDLQGEPFIGPAGEVLNEAFQQAGICRDDIYLTNAVKHFHWEPRGKQRLHKKPPARAIAACRPWLEAELADLVPRVLICLGATAAQAVLGRDTRQLKTRGEFFASTSCPQTLITWHPAAILRAPTAVEQQRRRQELSEHLRAAAELARAVKHA